jgi:hypothetical protein
MNNKHFLNDNLLVKMYAGSHAYGTSLPTSDTDFRGIFCADPINIRTPFFNVEEVTDTSEEDTKHYELSKFMKLCVDCNPNIIELLWTDESDIVSKTPAYDLLRSHREDLLSKKIAYTTTGYAYAQLKRIKGHNKWLSQPQPVDPPQQKDFVNLLFNMTHEKVQSFDPNQWDNDNNTLSHMGDGIYGLYPIDGGLFNDDGSIRNSRIDVELSKHPELLLRYNKDAYRDAKNKHEQYWQWVSNRNPTRAALEAEHGFDAKHAMHLVRLMRMGLEALTEGVIRIKRPDAKELLSIRAGSWSYEKIVEYAEEMQDTIMTLAKADGGLRKSPDVKLAAEILMEVQDEFWCKKD